MLKMKSLTYKYLAVTVTALCFLGLAIHANAQSSTEGSILGTVFDPTGAVVANATVTIANNATNQTTRETTNSSGYYVAPLLQPGIYTITVSAPGFGAYTASNVTVQVGVANEVDAHLVLKSSQTSVSVSGQSPILNFTTPDFSDVITPKAIRNIPINNRRWSSLAMLTPGVVSDANGYGLVSVRGISTLLNNVEIDGASDNQAFFSEERGRTREAYSTVAEAVREFKVNTGVYSAQYGGAAGGVITSVTKSGTNQLHGTLYFWDRESNWAAYNPFSKLTTFDPTTGTNVTTALKPEDLRKIYGFTVGGPLIKNKLFWIYTFDKHDHLFPGVAVPSNPASFFQAPDATVPAGTTCASNGYLNGGTTLDKQVCTMAARLGMTYPGAAAAYNAGIADLSTDLGTVPRTGDQEINNPQLDWQINSKEHLMLLYHRLRWASPGGVQTNSTANYGLDTWGNDFVKLDYGISKLISSFTPTISNELLYQYSRELDYETQQPYSAYTLAHLKAADGNVPEVELDTSIGFRLGSPYYSYREAYPDERKWQVRDILFYNRGNHNLSFGFNLLHNHDIMNNTYESNGVFDYGYITNYLTDLISKGTNTCNTSASPDASSASSNVIGSSPCYSDLFQGFGPPVFAGSTMDYGFFGEDNWKVTPRLSLDLGLRYDYESIPGPYANLVSATGNFVPYPQLNETPHDRNNFGPRVGFAYNLYGTGRTVVRGGVGVYYGRVTNGNILTARQNTGSPNGQFTVTYRPSSKDAPIFPNIVGGGNAPSTPGSDYLSKHLQNPMVYQYDLQVQQALGKGTVFQVSYLGSLGRELPNYLDLNLDPATTDDTITINDPSGKGPLPNGATYTVPTFTGYGNTALFGPAASHFQSIAAYVSNINASYNAFVAEIQNHTLSSIQFDANYTWSHALDFAQEASSEGSTNNWYDPYGDADLNYGNSEFNVPNRFVAYALYTLPRFVHTNSWYSYLANGWSLDDTFQMQNGLPYSAEVSGFIDNAVLSDWNGASGGSFIPPIGRNTYQTPRKIVDDARVQKAFRIKERYHLNLILNAYNIANHQNVDDVNETAYRLTTGAADNQGIATYQSSTFQNVEGSNDSGFLYIPRELEVILRLSF